MTEISLFGYGKTTKAIADRIKNCKIFDDSVKETMQKDGHTIYPSSQFDPQNSSLEIPSPGIPPYNKMIKKAKNLVSDYDFFLGNKNNSLSIWVSGTNGKTTTTKMLGYLLKEKGGVIGGNVGTPLADLKESDIYILETSSYTLHYTNIAKPNIYLLLPLSDDHISWHGSFEEYKNAKLSVLDRMDERDIAIIPKEFENYKTSAFKITYSSSEDLIEYFNFKDITFDEPFRLDEVLAKAIYKILFFEEKSLKEFKIDAHKIEEFRDKKNRLWVDDSKATNIDASIQALKKYKNKKINLILGGDSKAQNLTPLFEEIKSLEIELYLIGKDMPLFEELAKKYNIKYNLCYDLENAIKQIDKSFKDVALLSPASASLDQFSSYKERGNKFKEIIKNL